MDNTYSGPCVIFISSQKGSENNTIYVKDGLGTISKEAANSKLLFKNQKSSYNLDVIPIGNNEVKDSSRKNVYQLVKGENQVANYYNNIGSIRFYIGTPTEFLEWNSKYRDELEYLKIKGINWEKYYRENVLSLE